MILASQIRQLVSEYLRDAVGLEDFSDRFAAIFDDIEGQGDAEAVRLSYQIESCLADVSFGVANEAQLKEALIPCLTVTEISEGYRAKEVFIAQESESQYSELSVTS